MIVALAILAGMRTLRKRFREMLLSGIAGIVSVAATSAVFACPLCASNTARQVRAGLFDRHLRYNVMVTILPFVALSAIVTADYYGVDRVLLWLLAKGRSRHGVRSREQDHLPDPLSSEPQEVKQ